MDNNPFVVNRYESPKYFCNRPEINDIIFKKLTERENIQLVSPNGLGKTGLIKHIFYQIDQANNFNHIYLNLFNTSESSELLVSFISSILAIYHQKSQKKVNRINQIVFEESSPKDVQLIRFSEKELEIKLINLLGFLNLQKKPIIVVIDEFQFAKQFSSNFFNDSFLSSLKKVDNIQIVLLGTENSYVTDGFTKIILEKIPEDVYKRFINDLFNESDRTITKKSLSLIYNWADGETATIQLLCAKLWMSQVKKIKSSIVNEAISSILLENEKNLLIIKNLLSSYQWRLLKAIATEGVASQVTSSSFMEKYSLNAPSSVKTALTALTEKELIIRNGTSYKISSIILSKGLASI